MVHYGEVVLEVQQRVVRVHGAPREEVPGHPIIFAQVLEIVRRLTYFLKVMR